MLQPDALVLPGGLAGSQTLEQSGDVLAFVNRCRRGDKIVGAICAATKYPPIHPYYSHFISFALSSEGGS